MFVFCSLWFVIASARIQRAKVQQISDINKKKCKFRQNLHFFRRIGELEDKGLGLREAEVIGGRAGAVPDSETVIDIGW